jgi:hypothetical protein
MTGSGQALDKHWTSTEQANAPHIYYKLKYFVLLVRFDSFKSEINQSQSLNRIRRFANVSFRSFSKEGGNIVETY